MARFRVLALLFLGTLLAEARDPTIGLCTREKDLAKALKTTDALVAKLTAANSEKEKAKLGKTIATKHGRNLRIECLIRYREKDMRFVFLPLLEDKRWPIRARALYGLKMVGDSSVVPAVAARLEDADARVREAAANCLCHIATEMPPGLRRALEAEKDRYARASMEAAVAVIAAGERPYRPFAEKLTGPEGARRVERAWTVKGKNAFNDYDARTLDYPEAKSFDWPISWYEGDLFAPSPRKSFGANGNHAGEDMAWFREGCSYYAAADGLVRMVQGAGGDWGFLVAVEHRLPSGDYVMAIYGHCAWDVLVKPGDVVRKGQKIATQGLSCSVENGGYGSHLHFGLSDGPFRRPAGARRGSKVNLKFEQKTVAAPVVRLTYNPDQKDQYGFPGLGLVVRFPDGSERLLPVPAPDIGRQVAWMQGYVKGCVGWFDPRAFIGERRADG